MSLRPEFMSTEIFELQAFRPTPGAVKVSLVRLSQFWQLEYRLDSAGQPLQYQSRFSLSPGSRVDGLWRETCCELFVAGTDSQYLEFNFSPSGHWAAYAFDAPRQGMRLHEWAGDAPRITFTPQPARLQVELPAAALPNGALVCIALSVVLEVDGQHSYWALRHPGDQPDFHHRDSFVVLPHTWPHTLPHRDIS